MTQITPIFGRPEAKRVTPTDVEMVEKEAVMKGNRLTTASVIGTLKQKIQAARHQAVPELGIIPGLESDAQGIG